MHSDGPLPKTLDPVRAGRIGLWLLSLRSQKAATRRIAFPRCVWKVPTSFAARFAGLIVPWRIHEYPSHRRFLSELCGVSPHTVKKWVNGTSLPKKHALRLAQYLEQHASECEALAREMRAYEKNRRSGNKGRLTRS